MSHEPDLEDLLSSVSVDAFRAALQEAYRRGEESMRRKMLLALGVHGAEIHSTHFDAASEDDDDAQSRAPRGLAREVIATVLGQRGALATADLQRIASKVDPRVSPKTVYNELNRGRDKLYRLSMGRWNMINAGGTTPTDDELEAWLGKPEPA